MKRVNIPFVLLILAFSSKAAAGLLSQKGWQIRLYINEMFER